MAKAVHFISPYPAKVSIWKISQKKSLLVIEDSDEDFNAMQRIMKKLSVTFPIYRCVDADEASIFYIIRVNIQIKK
jgi:hypothetical protein